MVDISNISRIPDARTLILDLFAAYEGAPAGGPVLATRELQRAGEVFDLTPTALRTAIARLKQEGRLRSVGRGLYGQGASDDPWRRRIDGWRQVLGRRRAWDGAWLMAAAKPSSLPRAVWRSTARALEVEGFRRNVEGLWLRPDNLEGVEATRARLLSYGASPALVTARLCDLDAGARQAAAELWDVQALVSAHEALTQALSASLERLAGACSDAAAREALSLGRAGVRAIIRDPLLPDALADNAALEALLAMMDRYDRDGKAVWARSLGIGLHP